MSQIQLNSLIAMNSIEGSPIIRSGKDLEDSTMSSQCLKTSSNNTSTDFVPVTKENDAVNHGSVLRPECPTLNPVINE